MCHQQLYWKSSLQCGLGVIMINGGLHDDQLERWRGRGDGVNDGGMQGEGHWDLGK